MSDYISRNNVIDVLKETGIIQDNDLGHLVVDEINRIPTLDEKEIIRKTFKRVLKRLEEESFSIEDYSGYVIDFEQTYKIVKEEGGIE